MSRNRRFQVGVVGSLLLGLALALSLRGERTLSLAAKGALRAMAKSAAPDVSRGIQHARATALRVDACDQSFDVIAELKTIEAWGKRLVAELEACIAEVSARDGVEPKLVRRFLADALRSETADVIELSAEPGPQSRRFFAASHVSVRAVNAEEALEAVLAKLLAKLQALPPAAQDAVKAAILALRQVLVFFDTSPVSVQFTQPIDGLVTIAVPLISFEVTDTGSGPDPNSRSLSASVNGTVVDLSTYTSVAESNPVAGTMLIQATVPESALPDGLIVLSAAATDFAGNPPAGATRSFVLDRVGPAIVVSSPPAGGILSSSTVSLVATISDAVSGVDTATLVVKLNGVDVSGQVSVSGTITSISATANLSGAAGSNTLEILVADLAGNTTSASSQFSIVLSSLETISIEIVSGASQKGVGGTVSPEPLKVKLTGTSGLPLVGTAAEFTAADPSAGFATSAGAVGSRVVDSTDADGLISLRYLFGSTIGSQTVTIRVPKLLVEPNGHYAEDAYLPLHSNAAEASLSFEGLPTKIVTEVEAAYLQNGFVDPTTVYTSSVTAFSIDFAGSAHVVTPVYVLDGTNAPLVGMEVTPTLVDADGVALANPNSVGRFTPSRGKTDAAGAARFVFVSTDPAPSLQIHVSMQLTRFAPSPSSQVSRQWEGMLSPASRVARIAGGNGQVGEPGSAAFLPLAMEVVPGNVYEVQDLIIMFNVTPGQGKFDPVPDQGTFYSGSYDLDGNLVSMGVQTVSGKAAVKFTPLGTGFPKLVSVNDDLPMNALFVVAAPEVRFVSPGSLRPLASVQPYHEGAVGGESRFLVEKTGPLDGPSSQTITLKSVGLDGNDLEEAGFPQAGAPLERNVTLLKLPTSPGVAYATYRSEESAPLAFTSLQISTDTPDFGADAPIYGVPRGEIRDSMNLALRLQGAAEIKASNERVSIVRNTTAADAPPCEVHSGWGSGGEVQVDSQRKRGHH